MDEIEAVGVTKRYRTGGDERIVLDDVSLAIPTSRTVAVMGPSGSGKSSLLHILGGIDRSHDGNVTVGGIHLGTCSDDELAEVRRHRVGFVFQAFNLVPVLSALENVTLPGTIAGRSASSSDARALELLDLFGLVDRAAQRPVELSGGEQQRVAIARALFLDPAVLLADEPTGNLDSSAAADVIDVMTAANRELGKAVVLVTHDPAIAAAADDVHLLRDGTIETTLAFARQESALARRGTLARWLSDAASAAADAGPGRRVRPLVAR